jgi:hypothetical protein
MNMALKVISDSTCKPEYSESEICLRPVKVVAVDRQCVQIDLLGSAKWATMALPFKYQAMVGDHVLVIGQQNAFYVIGVIEGKGKTTLMANGDLELHAVKGKIDMVASEGVNIRSNSFQVIAKKLDYVADNVLQRFQNLTSRIKDIFELEAGSVNTKVETSYRLKAEKINQKAREDFKLDGKKIHLG